MSSTVDSIKSNAQSTVVLFTKKTLNNLTCPAERASIDYRCQKDGTLVFRVSAKKKAFYYKSRKTTHLLGVYCPDNKYGICLETAREFHVRKKIQLGVIKDYEIMSLTLGNYLRDRYQSDRLLTTKPIRDKALKELRSAHGGLLDIRLRDINDAVVRQFYSSMKRLSGSGKGRTSLDVLESTKRKRFVLLQSLFNTLKSLGYISELPFKPLKFKNSDPKPKVLKNVLELITHFSDKNHTVHSFNAAGRLVVLSCLLGGFRQSEILLNSIENFHGRSNKYENGQTGIYVPARISKTGNYRFVAINDDIWLDFLDSYKKSGCYTANLKINPNQLMCLNRSTGNPYTPQVYRSVWGFLQRKYNFSGQLYSARHTLATDLICNGEDINTVAQILGNNPITTAKFYFEYLESFEGTRSNALKNRWSKTHRGDADLITDEFGSILEALAKTNFTKDQMMRILAAVSGR
jgi:site-specific recombinase XerD